MRSLCRTVLTLAVMAALAVPALAQGQRRGGGLGQLLSSKELQEELKLSDDQIEKTKKVAADVAEKHRDDFAKLQDVPMEERLPKMMEIAKAVSDETVKGLADVLKPEQIARLKQIQIQQTVNQRGPGAFNDADVQKALKITAGQREKITSLADDFAKEVRELFSGGGGQEAFQKIVEMRKEKTDAVKALLTEDQKKAWKDLVGADFKFPAPMRRNNQ